jgi:TPR repeat protein
MRWLRVQSYTAADDPTCSKIAVEGVIMVPMRMFRIITLGLAVGLAQPVVAQSLENAAETLQPRAEQGDAQAQALLGTCYSEGLGGVSRDYAEALKWFRKAAEQGNGDGLANMGDAYAGGYGVPQNYVLAYMYVELAQAREAKTLILKMTRVAVLKNVTKAQIAEAKSLADKCLSANFKGCEKM